MQITKEITNSSEIQLHLTVSKLKTILLVCLISFTSLLVRQTLQVQHSCNPMIHWSGDLPAECKVVAKNDFDSFDEFSSTKTQTSKNEFGNFNDFSYPRQQELERLKHPQIAQKTEVYGPPNISSEPLKSTTPAKIAHQNSDLVGVGEGAAAGVGTAVLAIGVFSVTPPGAVLLGIGVAISVWQAIKKLF